MITKNIIRLLLVSSIGVSWGYSMYNDTDVESLQGKRAVLLKERCEVAKKKVLSDDDVLEKDTTKDTMYDKWKESAEIAAKSWNMSLEDYLKEAKEIVSQYSNSYRGPRSYLDLTPVINPYFNSTEKEKTNLQALCEKNKISFEDLMQVFKKQLDSYPKFTIPM